MERDPFADLPNVASADPFADLPNTAAGIDPFDDLPEAPTSTLRRAGDVGISALKGAISVPEAVVGLADIATLGRAGKLAEDAGFRPREAKAALDEFLSPAQKSANKAVSDAKGFIPTIEAAARNPSTIGHAVVESLPAMGAGGAFARGLPLAKKLVAGAIGEGVVSGGLAAEQIRQETKDGLLTPGQAAAAVASGIGTAVFSLAGARVAKKLGIADVDTLLAGGGAQVTQKGVARRIVEGGITEGVFEELPQSAQEKIWQNAAMDRPLLEGVPEVSAMGLLTGTAMGSGVNALPSGRSYEKLDAAGSKPAVAADVVPEDVEQVLSGDARQTTQTAAADPFADLPEVGQRALPAPKLIGTPEGEVGTQAQVEAAQAERGRRGVDLGTDEVADAVQGRAPLPDVGQAALEPATREPSDLLKTIAAAGGLSREAAQADGVDSANFKEQKYRTMVFGRPLFPKRGGMGMDELSEFMSQSGYLPEGQYSANDALDLIGRALSGEKIYSQQDAAGAAERAARQNEDDQRQQFSGKPGDTGVEYRAADLRSRMAEAGRNRVKGALGAEAARDWQPKPDDYALSGYSREAEDVQDIAETLFDGERVMGDQWESFYERFLIRNQDLEGDAFESTLRAAIRSHENAEKPGVPSEARQGAQDSKETAQSGDGKAQARQAAPAPAQAAPAVAAPIQASQPPAQPDRRTDTAGRKRVADLSIEEARVALLTDPLTGLPNRRAFEEAAKKPVQAAIDLDSLKWINDEMGHESGDKALAAIGQALRESGLEAYHLSGDEFMVQGDDRAAIEKGMAAVRTRLDNAVIHVEHSDGSTTTKTGVHFSYGIGATRNEADTALNTDKTNRQATGRRAARGEAPGGVERRAKGQQDNPDRPAGSQEVKPPDTAEQPKPTPPQGGVSASSSEKAEAKAETSPQSDLFAENVTEAIQATAESTKAVAEAVSGLKDEVADLRQDIASQSEQKKITDLLNDSRIAGITVKVRAVEAESGRKIVYSEKADVALRDVDERITLARRLAECLAS